MPAVEIPWREWMFCQQSGICYLQVTPECSLARGLMSLDFAERNCGPRYATIEHLYARARGMNKDLRGRYRLLACRQCNNVKGEVNYCTPEQAKYALMLARIYARRCSGMDELEAFQREKIPFFVRDLVVVSAVAVPVDREARYTIAKLKRDAIDRAKPPAPIPTSFDEFVTDDPDERRRMRNKISQAAANKYIEEQRKKLSTR